MGVKKGIAFCAASLLILGVCRTEPRQTLGEYIMNGPPVLLLAACMACYTQQAASAPRTRSHGPGGGGAPPPPPWGRRGAGRRRWRLPIVADLAAQADFRCTTPCGFSGHDAEGSGKTRSGTRCAPVVVGEDDYDARSGMVIYRSRMHKGSETQFSVDARSAMARTAVPPYPRPLLNISCATLAGTRTGFEPGALRRCGWAVVQDPEGARESTLRAKAPWARLIKKVYEADPLECPKCKGPMRVIVLINDAVLCK